MPLRRGDRATVVTVGLLAVAAVMFVVSSLRVPEVATFTPTVPVEEDVGPVKIGPRTVTVDASQSEGWRFFDFSRGAVVEEPSGDEWDLAFRRFQISVNGGEGFAGRGGALRLGEVSFDSVQSVPSTGYVGSERAHDSRNPVFERWYDYSWTSHLLTPKPDVYALRTADGRYVKLQIIGYYCEGAVAGCPTFRYVYQGHGGTDVATP